MFCEQAIFTSLRTQRQEGYQLAAASSGVSHEAAKELAQIGPAHDALLINEPGETSINFQPLAAGGYAISRTIAAGQEYSGRAGPRIYTQFLLVESELLARFANNPFAIVEAAIASGQMPVYDQPPATLEPVRLPGRASRIHPLRLAELLADPGREALLRALQLATSGERVALRAALPLARLFGGLLSLLPAPYRRACSFSTALRYSARRPVRWLALPPDTSEQRALQRASGATALDLTRAELPEPAPPEGAWTALWRDVFSRGQLGLASEILARAERFDPATTSLDAAATALEEDLRRQLALAAHGCGWIASAAGLQ